MKSITFSHEYKKMPHGVIYADTYISRVKRIKFEELTPQQIVDDTETVNGEFYPLPKGELIWIELQTALVDRLHQWQTIRRYTPWKFDYYKGLEGEQVKIIIKEESHG